jgi:hypothetical protein
MMTGKPLADVISIDKRRNEARKKENPDLPALKQSAVKSLFRCSCSSSECEKCGGGIPRGCPPQRDGISQHLRVPYRFCGSCSEEYIDYIERLKGKGNPDCYWRNESWLEVWTTWIHYRGAMDHHFKSKEFLQLTSELKPSPSEP